MAWGDPVTPAQRQAVDTASQLSRRANQLAALLDSAHDLGKPKLAIYDEYLVQMQGDINQLRVLRKALGHEHRMREVGML